MKKILSVILICAALCVMLSSCGGETLTLKVYNWGEYISEGAEGSYYTVKEFEKWYQKEYGKKVRVIYDTFNSNEDMYSKISAGAVSYDIAIPSDYMIARMIKEGMLEKIDFSNTPNYSTLNDSFKGLYYDPTNEYSVPYTYGIVGIIYDAKQVDEADAEGWDILWDSKYSGGILQYNNPRDAFGTAMYKLGIDVNTTDKADWDRAAEELKAQYPLVYSLVMDEIYNLMETGEAKVGSYYAGDYFTMLDAQSDNVDLRFYYPDPTNYYVDAMVILKGTENKELAESFINFMMSRDAAVANAEYTYYASPYEVVYTDEEYLEDLGEETIDILYPPIDNFAEQYNKYAYRNLPADLLDYINTLWEKVKIN